jgi:hypothetical protein
MWGCDKWESVGARFQGFKVSKFQSFKVSRLGAKAGTTAMAAQSPTAGGCGAPAARFLLPVRDGPFLARDALAVFDCERARCVT